MKTENIFKLIVSLVLCYGAGAIGGLFTAPQIKTWYAFLDKPFFNPPSWLFAPAWTLLYTLMAISVFLIWKEYGKDPHVRSSVVLFFVHLFFNFIWSIFFFYWHQLLVAFIDIVLIWLFIIILILRFQKINKVAAYLLAPYLAWVTFASLLNFSVWILNP